MAALYYSTLVPLSPQRQCVQHLSYYSAKRLNLLHRYLAPFSQDLVQHPLQHVSYITVLAGRGPMSQLVANPAALKVQLLCCHMKSR